MTADLFIGIDPGKAGGLVALDQGGALAGYLLMPTVGKGTKRERVSLGALLAWYRGELAEFERVTVAIERVSSAPSDGVVSAFSFGKAVQAAFDFGEALEASIVEVSPKDWQRVFLRGHRRDTREHIKASAALVAGERWPGLREPLQRKNRWGLADAALIAGHARLQELAASVAGSS